MLTQALALANPEAPLIQAGPADQPGKSYEQFYGPDTGAVRAGSAGRVLKVAPDEITVKQEDGLVKKYELADNLIHNPKSYLHDTPVVSPGDVVQPDQLLARSNYMRRTSGRRWRSTSTTVGCRSTATTPNATCGR